MLMIMVGFGSRQFTHQTAYQRRSFLAKPGGKGVTANPWRKLREMGEQPGRGVKPPMRHHLREHRCHGRLRRPMLHQRDAPYPRPSLDLEPRLFLHG